MNKSVVALLLMSSLTFGQASSPKSPTPPQQTSPQTAPQRASDTDRPQEKPSLTNPAAATSVGEDEAVITIPGACSQGTPADTCSTKITRRDFERLISAMNPNIPSEARRSIANSYGQLVAMANQAQKAGVDKEPNLQIQMQVQAMSLMAQALQKKIVEDSKPSQADIDNYYKQNSAKYEELNLRRVVVLKSASSDLKPEQLKALADQIRTRMAAGEDMDKLEADAYNQAKSSGTPPNTSLGWKKPAAIDPRYEAQIVMLKTGEVSPIFEDGQAYYIYKVEEKRVEPLPTVQKEIEGTLQSERAKKTFQQMLENSKPQLNEAYFGPAESPKAAPSLNPQPK